MPQYEVAGLSGTIELPVPLIVKLIPVGQVNQRPGIKLKAPLYWVQHETGNRNTGANAAMHSRWLHAGAGGQVVSFHFAVDDKQIYQFLPVDEVSWQAADGAGPGNMSGVSCEMCINQDGNETLARRNAEALAGGVMKALGLPPDRIKRHWDFNYAQTVNRHYCPERMMRSGYWPTFVSNVTAIIKDGGPPVVNPTYAKPTPPAAGDSVINDRLYVGVEKKVTTVVPITPRKWADGESSATGPTIPTGTVLDVTHVCVGSDKDPWYIIRDGSRVPVAATIKGAI